jgi:hypothetical protein
MFVMAVTSSLFGYAPSIGFDEPDHVANLHNRAYSGPISLAVKYAQSG